MLTQYPYEGQQNPAIHWESKDTVSKELVPGAVEINQAFTYFNDEAVQLGREERIVVVNFLCGRHEPATLAALKPYVPDRSIAAELIENTYEKFGVTRDKGSTERRQDRLVARAYMSHALDPEQPVIPLPEDWQQPFRDLVLMLAAEYKTSQLAQLFQFTNAENHLAMATGRIAEELGLGHLERGGPTLIALAASLLPDSDEAITDRIRSPLTDDERSSFETLPPRGGLPLLPVTPSKMATREPAFIPGPSNFSPVLLRPPIARPEPSPRVAHPVSQPAPIDSRIVRPHERIRGFGNETLWLQLDSIPARDANRKTWSSKVSLLGIQHAEIEIGKTYIPGQIGGQLTPIELTVFCARALGLTVEGVSEAIGVSRSAQHMITRMVHAKMGIRVSDPKVCAHVLERRSLSASLAAGFEDPQLFRTRKPPQFDGLEEARRQLLEIGPFLVRGDTNRTIRYNIAEARKHREPPEKLPSVIAVGGEIQALRKSLRLSTLGLALLYLAHMDYQKQLRAGSESSGAEE